MVLVEVGNKYNENGKNIQLSYSRKYIEKCPSVLSLKNSTCSVLFCVKPIESVLNIMESDERIYKIDENIFISGSGLSSDQIYIQDELRKAANSYREQYGCEMTGKYLKTVLNRTLTTFSHFMGLRVIGSDFIIIKREQNKYFTYYVKNNGSILRYKGCVIGSMYRKAQTEIEKLDLENMNLDQILDSGVKSIYKSFDPLVDKEFELEIGFLSEGSGFRKLTKEEIEVYVNRHKDLTVEDVE